MTVGKVEERGRIQMMPAKDVQAYISWSLQLLYWVVQVK